MTRTFSRYVHPLLVQGQFLGIIFTAWPISFIPSLPYFMTYLISVWFTVNYLDTMEEKMGASMSASSSLTLGSFFLALSIKLPYYWRVRYAIRDVIAELTALDVPDHSRTRMWKYFATLLATFITLLVMYIFGSTAIKSDIHIFIMVFFYISNLYVCLLESMIMNVILKELVNHNVDINRKLDIVVCAIEDYDVDGKKNALDQVCGMLQQHFVVVRISRRVNDLFGLPSLGIISMEFVMIATCSQGMAMWYLTLLHDELFYLSSVFITTNSIWVLILLCHLIWFIRCWTSIIRTARETIEIIYKFTNRFILSNLNTDGHQEIDMTNLHVMSIEILNNKLEFTAQGLFPLDYSLLHKIISAVTAYVVFLIKFEHIYSFSEAKLNKIL